MKTFLVTGTTSGLGLEIVRNLAKEGKNVSYSPPPRILFKSPVSFKKNEESIKKIHF